MGTYYHWLKTKVPHRLPKRIISLYAVPEVHPINGQGNYRRHTLLRCGVCVTDYRAGVPVRHGAIVLRSAVEIVDTLATNALPDGNAIIVCHDLPYTATLCGFWRACQEGVLSVVGWSQSQSCEHFTIMVGGNSVLCVGLEGYFRGRWDDYCEIASYDGQSAVVLDESGCDCDHAAVSGARVVDGVFRRLSAYLYTNCNRVFRPTLAGIAWDLFRSRRWGERIKIHGNAEATAAERHAHTGCKPVCFRRGKVQDKINVLDINSMYGWCMLEYKYPVRLLHYGSLSWQNAYQSLRTGKGVIAYLSMDKDGSANWLSDRCTTIPDTTRQGTWLCGSELFRAINECRAPRIQEGAIYRLGSPFRDYIRHVYALKRHADREEDKASRWLSKMLLCQFYGYWAARSQRWTDYPQYWGTKEWGYAFCPDPKTGVLRPVLLLAGKARMLLPKGEMPHSFPAISAYVTMYAREYLNEMVEIAGRENVHYTDTDSIHTSQVGKTRLALRGLIDATRIGALKIVGEYDGGSYYGPKRYTLAGVTTAAGLSHTAIPAGQGSFIQDRREGLDITAQRGWIDSVVVYSAPYTLA